jgi:CHAT domain-containing protein
LLVFLAAVFSYSAILTRDQAQSAFEKLQEIGPTNEPKLLDRKAIIANDLAVFYQSVDDIDQSIVFLLKAIQFTEKRIQIENKWTAQNYKDLQDLYLNLTRIQGSSTMTDEAKESYQKAKVYFDKLQGYLDQKAAHISAFNFYATGFSWTYHGGLFEEAEAYAQKALYHAKQSGEREFISSAHRDFSELSQRLGNKDKASYHLKTAIAVIRSENAQAPLDQHLVRSYLASLYKNRDYKKIIAFMRQEPQYASTEVFERKFQTYSIRDYGTILENTFILSYAYIRHYQETGILDNLNNAREWQRVSYKLLEAAVMKNDMNKLGSILDTPKQKITSTLKNFELLNEARDLTQEEISQLLRTVDVYHATQLHVNRLKDELYGENWESQKEIRATLDSVISALETPLANATEYKKLQKRSFELSKQLTTLLTKTKKDQLYNEYKIGQEGFSREMGSFTKTRKSTIVTYFWSEQLRRLYVFGKNPQSYFFKSIDVGDHFEALITETYRHNSVFLTRPDALARQDSLNQLLYQKIVAPIRDKISTEKIVIYPIGSISYIAFDALKPTKEKYFIHDHTVSYTSSLFALLRKKNNKRKTISASAFYPKNYGTDTLSRLYNAASEIKTLSALLPTTVYQGRQASKKKFLQHANNCSVIHIASHSILNPNNPFQSYLVFEKQNESKVSNKLHASEIFSKTIDADLVVLSSCNSAKGLIGDEVGIISLSNAFYFSGVPSTVGSLWSAQDFSSAQIMQKFYGHLVRGKTISKSLTDAKKDFLNNADRVKSQPFFWANYVALGADEKILFSPNESHSGFWWQLIGTVSLILLLYNTYKFFRISRASSA